MLKYNLKMQCCVIPHPHSGYGAFAKILQDQKNTTQTLTLGSHLQDGLCLKTNPSHPDN